jgi:uncharacterized protein with HEPN domain
MRPETKKYLYDMLKACEAIFEFTEGKDFASYETDLLLRSAVERQLMIVGEAMNQAMHDEPDICDYMADAREIVNLRNVIVHGYAVVENETIWGIVQGDLPALYDQVKRVLG